MPEDTPMLPILHVGLGPLGQRVAADLVAGRVGRVVAAIDLDPKLAGRDLAEVVAQVPRGVTIRAALEAIADWSPIRCAIVTTSSDLERCMETFRALLVRGLTVVSTCEELAWPWLRHPVLAQELDELAIRHGGRLLGTGVNPGFLMDALPVMVTSACSAVRAVRVWRVQDASKRRVPFQRKIGATLDREAFARKVADGSLRHVGLGESLHFLGSYLGIPIERWEETLEPVIAERDMSSAIGPVQRGSARGVRQVARAWSNDAVAIELVFLAALEEPESYDRVQVDGDPPLDLTFKGGVHGDTATSALVINSIRPLLAARPGLHTMASIPAQGCARSLG
jgi:4-hydroxy-tetrahydrodipicolinate reductase